MTFLKMAYENLENDYQMKYKRLLKLAHVAEWRP